jgi:hypothetical protein
VVRRIKAGNEKMPSVRAKEFIGECVASVFWCIGLYVLVYTILHREPPRLFERNKQEQVKMNGKLVGGYNQLIEYFADLGKVNFKGEIIDKG